MNGIFLSIALTAKLNRDKNCINRNKKARLLTRIKSISLNKKKIFYLFNFRK